MNDKAKTTGSGQTQTARRVKYGLNVALAVLIALALAVLVNWIAYRRYVRFDLTAMRQYSLSEQTQRVLANLEEDYRIVTLFRVSGPRLAQVRDLIDEYGRYSSRIDVQHIDPDLGVSRRDQFYKQLRERFDDELAPLVAGIESGRDALEQVTKRMAELVQPLDEAMEHPQLADGELKQFIGSVRAAFTNTQSQIQERQSGLDIALEQSLPDYRAIRQEVERLLRELDEGLLAVAVDRFERAVNQAGVPAQVKDRLLGVSDQLKALRDQVRASLEAVREATVDDRYDQLVMELRGTESVVVVSPSQVRVIDVLDMFRRPDPEMVQQAGQAELQFLGEERLTGALVSMSVEQPAMVVFVTTGSGAAIGPRGAYRQVAERLEAANFRVEQWNPAGQMTAMGQQMPPQPPPQAQDGQQTIWIVLPFAPSPDPRAMMAASGMKQQIAQTLETALSQGDAALVMLSVNPAMQFGAGDPIVDLVETWGINPQLDRIVMQQVQLPNRQTRASAQFMVDQWPDALPITKALTGMQALFLQGSPLVATDAEEVMRWPLVKLRGQRIWAEDDFASLQGSPQDAEFDPAASADAFTIAMAAQRGEGEETGRMIVVADPAWASDSLTTYGAMGPGTAELFGAAFPGNGELFVNSVYWLSGLDELIAASPRTQDIRRINPLTPTAVYTYRTIVLAGLPLVIIAVGLGVWMVRRRG